MSAPSCPLHGDWRDDFPPNHSALWTADDDAKLRRCYSDPDLTRHQVATEMGRTIASCDQRAQQKGISRPVRQPKAVKPPAPPKKIKATKPPGRAPSKDSAEYADAERHADNIRAWHAERGIPATVVVQWMLGRAGHKGWWSAVIQ